MNKKIVYFFYISVMSIFHIAMPCKNAIAQAKPNSIKDLMRVISGHYTNTTSIFGVAEEIPFAFEGTIYHLPPKTYFLPNFDTLKPVGKIFTTKLNIPKTRFEKGFPGVTNRFEWFAIDYKSPFYIHEPGEYTFLLMSDDGSKLFIDGNLVIDNDGQHNAKAKKNTVTLSKGFHYVEVQYFQGPKVYIALKLFAAKKEGKFSIFNTVEYAPVKITSDTNEIRIHLGDDILFDFNKYTIKPYSKIVLNEIWKFYIEKLPALKVIVEGHTDSVGTVAYNKKLSLNRANAVKNYFTTKATNPMIINALGCGETQPRFPNNTEENMAKNRRVEIVIKE